MLATLDVVEPLLSLFFFFNDTATTEIYTLSLHDALPISITRQLRGRRTTLSRSGAPPRSFVVSAWRSSGVITANESERSEEHTSELQSRLHLVCRLLLEKKKKKNKQLTMHGLEQTNQQRH